MKTNNNYKFNGWPLLICKEASTCGEFGCRHRKAHSHGEDCEEVCGDKRDLCVEAPD